MRLMKSAVARSSQGEEPTALLSPPLLSIEPIVARGKQELWNFLKKKQWALAVASTLLAGQLLFLFLRGAQLFAAHQLGAVLALFFFTFFAALLAKSYFTTTSSEVLLSIKECFLQAIGQLCLDNGYPARNCHFTAAAACKRLAEELQRGSIAPATRWNRLIGQLWQPIVLLVGEEESLSLAELLFFQSIEEQMELVQIDPLDLKPHAALVELYIGLCTLYTSWMERSIYRERDEKQEKLQIAKARAVEECRVLSEFAPKNRWAREKLAKYYGALKLSDEELKEYEILIEMNPNDCAVLEQLGILYFQQSQYAKGLQVYEQLKHQDSARARTLLSHYQLDF